MKLCIVYKDVDYKLGYLVNANEDINAPIRMVEIELTPEQIATIRPNKGEQQAGLWLMAEPEPHKTKQFIRGPRP